jgi:hypothetical protein
MNNKDLHFELDYKSKIVKIVLNLIYNSTYLLTDLETDEILLVLKLVDELQLCFSFETQSSKLSEIYKTKINEDNWIDLLNSVPEIYIYDDIKQIY